MTQTTGQFEDITQAELFGEDGTTPNEEDAKKEDKKIEEKSE